MISFSFCGSSLPSISYLGSDNLGLEAGDIEAGVPVELVSSSFLKFSLALSWPKQKRRLIENFDKRVLTGRKIGRAIVVSFSWNIFQKECGELLSLHAKY